MLLITNPSLPEVTGKTPGVIGGSYVLQAYLTNGITLIISIGGAVTLFMLLAGGFEYITAGGDKEATQKATKRISSGLIGLVILLASFAIITAVEILFGIPLLKFSIPVIN